MYVKCGITETGVFRFERMMNGGDIWDLSIFTAVTEIIGGVFDASSFGK